MVAHLWIRKAAELDCRLRRLISYTPMKMRRVPANWANYIRRRPSIIQGYIADSIVECIAILCLVGDKHGRNSGSIRLIKMVNNCRCSRCINRVVTCEPTIAIITTTV